jgi:hypothetical protein
MFGKLFGTNKQKDFWKWFANNQQELYHFEGNQEELFNQLSHKLKSINNDLVFEFGPIHETGIREFSISADGIKAAFPDVIALMEKAPDFPNWNFYAFRQRVPGDDINIQMGGLKLGYSDIFFRYDEENDKIGIELNIRNYDPDNKAIKNAVFILLDGLIGEYDMETNIGWIDFVPLDEKNLNNLFPLIHLRDLVDLSKI